MFPCVMVVRDGIFRICYGAADKACCLATVRLEGSLDFLLLS
ncbi:MAG: hypothetical protein JRH06_17330 [Deltaproteobacteria bacterium]|nr:hypothetical protein [Deltaproteobacteria bacterium]